MPVAVGGQVVRSKQLPDNRLNPTRESRVFTCGLAIAFVPMRRSTARDWPSCRGRRESSFRACRTTSRSGACPWRREGTARRGACGSAPRPDGGWGAASSWRAWRRSSAGRLRRGGRGGSRSGAGDEGIGCVSPRLPRNCPELPSSSPAGARITRRNGRPETRRARGRQVRNAESDRDCD